MSTPTPPQRRASVPGAVGQNRRRIEILEATPPPVAGGSPVWAYFYRFGSHSVSFGNSPTQVYLSSGNEGGSLAGTAGFSLDGTYGIYLPGDGNGFYQVDFWVWVQNNIYTTRDWAIDMFLFTDNGYVGALENFGSIITKYSNTANIRKPTMQQQASWRIPDANTLNSGATQVGIGFQISNGVTVPGSNASWTVAWYSSVIRVDDYQP